MEQHEIDCCCAEIHLRDSMRLRHAAAMMRCDPDLSPLPPDQMVEAFREARRIRTEMLLTASGFTITDDAGPITAEQWQALFRKDARDA
ncbi:hypothetical protein [Thalassobaculum litoreum]|uniref:hypothetical protein n=1 Tax=Thalassobaculum litoreum TaxID=420996 RepID=UPI001113D9CF|nr:hypothetical protein [Thalassobaculum litoreum]